MADERKTREKGYRKIRLTPEATEALDLIASKYAAKMPGATLDAEALINALIVREADCLAVKTCGEFVALDAKAQDGSG